MTSAILDIPINVKNGPFVARGDGSYDDARPILTAIQFAASRGGGTVVIPSGDYRVSTPISWDHTNVVLQGEAGTRIVASPNFKGESLIQIGNATTERSPTYYGGLRDIEVDVTQCSNPDLVGVRLTQTWFTQIQHVRIMGPMGLSQVRQTAFQITAGGTENSKILDNWACNIGVYNLQITGSFKVCLSHISGVKNPVAAQVNRVNYFGGFAFGAGRDRAGSFGARFETGDTCRVYGFALEDFETGCFIGTPNGPIDFVMEDCATEYVLAGGLLKESLGTGFKTSWK